MADLTATIKIHDAFSREFRKFINLSYGAKRSMNLASRGMAKSWNMMGKAARKAFRLAEYGAIAAAVATIKVTHAAAKFENQMAKVSTMVDKSSGIMKEYRKGILALSREAPKAINDLTEALYQTLSASVDTAQAMNFLEKATKLAVGGFTSTEMAVDTLTTIMNAYGMSIDRVNIVSDMLIETQNKGKTTVDLLGQGLGKIIPTAAGLGIELHELLAALATLTAGGISTHEAITALNMAMMKLGAPGMSIIQIFEKLRRETELNFEAVKEEVGSLRALKAVLALTGQQAELFAKNIRVIGEAAGTTEKNYADMMDTMSAKWQLLKNALDALQITLGQITLGPAKDLVDKITEFFHLMTGAIEAQGFLKTWGDVLTSMVNMFIMAAATMGKILGVALSDAIDGIGGYYKKQLKIIGKYIIEPTTIGIVAKKILKPAILRPEYYEPILEMFKKWYIIQKENAIEASKIFEKSADKTGRILEKSADKTAKILKEIEVPKIEVPVKEMTRFEKTVFSAMAILEKGIADIIGETGKLATNIEKIVKPIRIEALFVGWEKIEDRIEKLVTRIREITVGVKYEIPEIPILKPEWKALLKREYKLEQFTLKIPKEISRIENAWVNFMDRIEKTTEPTFLEVYKLLRKTRSELDRMRETPLDFDTEQVEKKIERVIDLVRKLEEMPPFIKPVPTIVEKLFVLPVGVTPRGPTPAQITRTKEFERLGISVEMEMFEFQKEMDAKLLSTKKETADSVFEYWGFTADKITDTMRSAFYGLNMSIIGMFTDTGYSIREVFKGVAIDIAAMMLEQMEEGFLKKIGAEAFFQGLGAKLALLFL